MERVYRYVIFNKFGELLKYMALALVVNIIIQWGDMDISGTLKGMVLMTLILFAGRSFLRWIEYYKLDHENLHVIYLYRKKQSIPFDQINRVIVKEEVHYIFGPQTKMSIILKNGNKKYITVSDLHQSASFILAIKKQAHQFRFIQQDIKGELIPS
ncbi:MAG: hypothetical protein MK226_07970 [Saprospiraceae bacterium]|jgi:hypothetical protein|nr:hypothetical protein [Saprospiraceae bacterium]